MTPEQERLVQAMLAEQVPQQPPAEDRTWRNVAAAGELALGALPFTRLGRAMLSTVPRAAASAAGIGAAGAAAQHMVTPAEAEGPGDLQTARDTIGKLRARQGELEAERNRLSTERLQFDKIDSGNRNAVAEAQRRLGLRPDGNWGPDTSRAIAAHKQNVERQIEALDRQTTRLSQDLETQQQRLTGLEGGERLREAERNVDPFSSALRKYGEIGGTAVGVGLGALGRMGMVRHANRAAQGRARLIEEMLDRRATQVAPRTGRLNEVWRRGGAEPGGVPFTPAPGTKYGVATNPNVTPSSALFPGRPGIRGQVTGTDAAVMAGLGAEGGVAEYRRVLADREVAEAQEAAQRDPSAVNIERLQRAINNAAFWQALARIGQAGAVSYGVTATKTPRVYPRPDLQRADAEMANLNRLINPPKPARKRKK